MSKIIVNGQTINIIQQGGEDYISLTEMVENHPDGNKLIERWMNNKSTIDFLGVWEQMYNVDFKTPEFRGFRENVGSGGFFISVKKWIDITNAIGVTAKAGRGGGTFAHKDIAFEFGTYISPVFKLALIKEFQFLKENEAKKLGGHWDFRRFTAKVNLKIQTDAVKQVLIPLTTLPEHRQGILYAEASDIIYIAMFGYTSKQWREKNPELAKKGWNIRDVADTHQLIVLANLENIDALLVKNGIHDKYTRIKELRKEALSQVKLLRTSNELQHELIESPHLAEYKHLKETDQSTTKQTPSLKAPLSDFNNKLNTALKYNPKDKG